MLSNLTALTAARERALPGSRRRGIAGTPATIYCSSEAHYSIVRAAEVLGLGSDAVRSVPIDANRRACVPRTSPTAHRRRPGGGRHADRRDRDRGHHAHRRRRPDRGPRRRLRRARRLAARRRRLRPARGGGALDEGRSSPASSARTRCRSTPTSGCTCRRPAASSWCATTASLVEAFAHDESYILHDEDERHAVRHDARVLAAVPRAQAVAGVAHARRRGLPRGASSRTCSRRACCATLIDGHDDLEVLGDARPLDRAVPAPAGETGATSTPTTCALAHALDDRRPRLRLARVRRRRRGPAAVHRQLPDDRRRRARARRRGTRARRPAPERLDHLALSARERATAGRRPGARPTCRGRGAGAARCPA